MLPPMRLLKGSAAPVALPCACNRVKQQAWSVLPHRSRAPARLRPVARAFGDAAVPVYPALSPWDSAESSARLLDKQFAEMQQQLDRQMDSAFSFGDIRRFERQMDEQMRQMDQQMDRAFREMDQFSRDMDLEMERSMRKLAEQQPEVRIDRHEQRGPGTYRYYESIQIHSGRPMAALVPAQTTSPTLFNPLLLLAVLLAGAYAVVSAAFVRNFDLTTYQKGSRWQLALLWPVLALGSKRFREQLVSALKGEKVTVSKRPEAGGKDGFKQQ